MNPAQANLNRVIGKADIIAALALIGVVVMMIVPIPPALLDILLTFNISFAILILLVSIYTLNALEFSIFPTLLLVTTLLRLSLNVSTTRLVLLHGYAGEVVKRFGEFVVGGNTLVGIVMFLILVLIQFIVITKGAERVSEVAARFTLDAMPGKQMAIDADLNAGMINDTDARQRRLDIQREADFYGAMDGASKFIKGDAIAGIVIVIINITGGLIIGMMQRSMSWTEASQTYTILTIGDGLVTQIPALLISTAAGIVVTRSASETNLGTEFTNQLTSQPQVFAIASVFLTLLGFTGLPALPMLTMATLFAILYFTNRKKAEVIEEEAPTVDAMEAEQIKKPENVMELLQIEKMEMELGYSLIPLVDAEQGGDLLDRIVMIRRQCAVDLGFVVPPIRIRDNMQLKPNMYMIKMKGLELSRGELILDNYLAIGPGIDEDVDMPGIDTLEPAFRLPARWIDTAERERAEMKGYTVVDPPSVVATHLTQVIKSHAHELLGRQDVLNMVNYVKEQNAATVDELIPDVLSLGELQKILANLLREQVPIRDLVTIMEALADYARITKDSDVLTEYARQALKRHITKIYAGEERRVPVIALDPSLEEYLRDSVQQSEFGSYLAVDPNRAQNLVKKLNIHIDDMVRQGMTPVVICAPVLRIYFKKLLERFIPNLAVLSYNELESDVEIDVVGMVSA
ncbi:MAG: flagellar biosynthesis protein FlhA [Solirubrobacterales bacterium]